VKVVKEVCTCSQTPTGYPDHMAKTKTRAGGTWTEARFFGFVRSNLRLLSRKWPPVHAAKNQARRAYVGENKRQKYEYQCSDCLAYHAGKETQVDHVTPAGSLKRFEDLPDFVSRLLCEAEGFRVLCKPCHQKRTNNANND